MKKYHYNCIDKSILLPFLKKYVFENLHRLTPYGLPANYITLISSIIMWITFIYFLNIDNVDTKSVILALTSIIVYVILDHIDGLQAKASSTSSPLGEILDHFSDVFNAAIVLFLTFSCLLLEFGALFLIVIWSNFIAFAATYVEQRERRVLYFGKLGSLEGIVLVLLVLFSCINKTGLFFWHNSDFSLLPNYLILISVVLLGSFITTLNCLIRIGNCPKDFINFFVSGAILVNFFYLFSIPWYLAFLVITGYSADYILKCMQAHFFETNSRHPDSACHILIIGLVLLKFIEWEFTPVTLIFWTYGSLLFFKIIIRGKILFQEFRHYWIWWNKPILKG